MAPPHSRSNLQLSDDDSDDDNDEKTPLVENPYESLLNVEGRTQYLMTMALEERTICHWKMEHAGLLGAERVFISSENPLTLFCYTKVKDKDVYCVEYFKHML